VLPEGCGKKGKGKRNRKKGNGKRQTKETAVEKKASGKRQIESVRMCA
jgi:hypothetical protein